MRADTCCDSRCEVLCSTDPFYTSTAAVINIFAAFPPQSISVTYLYEDPFILSCDSAYLPPQLVIWEMNQDLISEGHIFSFSSHLIHRRNSSYESTLVMAVGHAPPETTTFKCIVQGIIQPYYDYHNNGDLSKSKVQHTCEPLKHTVSSLISSTCRCMHNENLIT